MITGRQIRAARALLDISQDELAVAAGLTKQGISKIEDGSVQPREGTIADIGRVFDEKRIEFMENEGVRFRPEGVEVLNGERGLARFSESVFSFAQSSGGIIRQIGIEENALEKYAPKIADMHRLRMANLVKTKKDIYVRAILKDGDNNFISTNYADYRWYPSNIPAAVPYYIFGDTVCIFTFDADPAPKIILVTSPAISSTYCAQFDEIWELAHIPSLRTKEET